MNRSKKFSQSNASVEFSPAHDQELFNFMVNHIGDEIMFIDENAHIVYVNNATVNGIGLSREALLKKRVIDFYTDKSTIEKWRKESFLPLKKNRKPGSVILDRTVKGGKIQTIEATAVYINYKNRGYILSVARDITKQVAMQNLLAASESLYRLITEGASDGIFTVDLKGGITFTNNALERMLMLPLSRSYGKHFLSFVEKKSISRALSCFNKLKRGAAQVREELDLVDKNGKILPVEVNASPLMDQGKIASIHGVVRDMSRRHQLEKFVRESEKMKAIQFFASGMAKEIKHPLLAILHRVEDILRQYEKKDFEYIGYKDFANLLHALNNTRNQLQDCFVTTSRLVDLVQKRFKKKDIACDINGVIRECLHFMTQQFKLSGAKTRLHLASHLPLVKVDDIELNQILANVLTNSLQAMPGGGVVHVSTSMKSGSGMVCLEIKDNGIGIAKENLAHVFEPFFSTKIRGVEKNPGLGLSIVYSIVKSCQGEIAVESSLSRGTKVTIYIPVFKRK